MTRRIPAQYQYASIAARRHPHRDRNKHRLKWSKAEWGFHHLEQAAVAVGAAAAAAFTRLLRPFTLSHE